jgi:hypothetical protein
MNSRKLDKPIKSFVLNDCAFKITEEDDGLIVEVTPIEEDREGNIRIRDVKGVCRSIFDMWNNLIGCEDVGACDKNCMQCIIYDQDGNELGEACRCTDECPEPPDSK